MAEGSVCRCAAEPHEGGRVRVLPVLKTAGVIIGFMIAAGFATGQETLQYYTSEGFWGIGGVAVAYGFVFWLFYCFMTTGQRTGLTHSRDIFKYYCGRRLGMVYEILTIVLLFLVSATMVSSVGAIVSQYFGLPEVLGRAVMSLLVMGSVLLGLGRFLEILSPIGPIIIVLAIVIAIVSVAGNPEGLANAPSFIEQLDPPMVKASAFWWLSGILYGIMNVFPLASFGASLGSCTGSRKEALLGAAVAAVALFAAGSCMVLAQLSNIDLVFDQAVPTLKLAQTYLPVAAGVLSIILLMGIYTTVVPSMWAMAQAFGEDCTKCYRMVVVAGCAGVFVLSFFPFEQLMNVIYPFSGYAAWLMVFCMAFKHMRLFVAKHRR